MSGFFDDLDPEIKCQVLAFRHPQIVAHLSTVTVPKNGRVKRDRGREVFKVTAIAVCVARYLCEHEIVRIEGQQSKVSEPTGIEFRQPVFIPDFRFGRGTLPRRTVVKP